MRILILEHEPETPGGLVEAWASARGHELDLAAVPRLGRWPAPGEHDAVISLGSDSSVHASPDPWIARELDLLAAAHAQGVPVLGICFGGQALAKALGGEVRRAPRAEVSWREISSDGAELITPGPWFRWHSDRFTLPPAARLLAGSESQPDAFMLERSLGLQFHPEVDAALAEKWVAGGRAKLTEHGIDTGKLLEEVARQAPGARERAFELLDRIAEWWALSEIPSVALRRHPLLRQKETTMASVQQRMPSEANGAPAASTIPVENPATGELITTIPILGSEQIEAIARRARAAQPAWDAVGFQGRARVLRRAQKWMLDNAERILDAVVSETGKTHEDAQLTDLGYTVSALGFWAKEAPKYLADERVPSWNNPVAAGRKLIIRYAPVGVVGVIGPWNYPIANSFGDCIPALAAGNSVILKPSEVTPLSSLLMEEMMRECGLPEDVFQVATGDGSTGAALIGHVDCVMFTGSSRTGKAVMKAAADALIPCYLELGGKDPMIVCADANIDRAANAAAFYSMNNGGQVCISVERVYVEEPVYDEFVQKVTDNVRKLRQGPPAGVGTVDIGAVTFPPQIDLVDDHVRDAVDKGATVLVGGHVRPGAGRFYEPTVLVDVDHSMKIMQEETFGPTLPIMKVSDVEDGVRLANDSSYGLQASVWTRDVERGEQLARRIEAGVVCVNDAQINYSALNLPMGGWKSSGLGTRHGANGIRKYCKLQSLLVTRRAPKRELFMFPYGKRRTMILRRMFKLLYGRGKRY